MPAVGDRSDARSSARRDFRLSRGRPGAPHHRFDPSRRHTAARRTGRGAAGGSRHRADPILRAGAQGRCRARPQARCRDGRGRFIAYSLGNFWTYGRFNLSGPSGLAPVAALEVTPAGELVSARIVSARQDRPGGPVLDPSGAAARRIAELTARDVPEAGIRIEADGTVRWRR